MEVPPVAQDENKNVNAKFCIKSVANQMEQLSTHEDSADIQLAPFVSVYEELCKFIKSLGKIFEFVEKDVHEKLVVLKNLHENDPTSFKTIENLINSEKPDKIKLKHSGAVAILHLNRALEFIVEFMNAAASATNEDSIPKICRECYDATLAKHHPWIIKTAVKVAVYTLPTREKMLEYIQGSITEEAQVQEQINLVVSHGKLVHARINTIYTTHELHQLA